ncbi:MAG: GntR family transcriptional regulator [Phycisphaerales bacterium]
MPPLRFILDLESTVPIFRQIVDGLRGEIAKGAIAAGELLPSVRTIAEELGVNPNTVHKAVTELEREGLVATERGRGMVVVDGVRVAARAGAEDAVLTRLSAAVRHARSVGMSDERFETLLRKARRLAADAAVDARDNARKEESDER